MVVLQQFDNTVVYNMRRLNHFYDDDSLHYQTNISED